MGNDEQGAGVPSQAATGKKRGLRPAHVVTIVALALVIIAIVQNLEKTQVSFLWMDVDIGLWLLVLVSVLLGVVLGAGGHIFYKRGKRPKR